MVHNTHRHAHIYSYIPKLYTAENLAELVREGFVLAGDHHGCSFAVHDPVAKVVTGVHVVVRSKYR